MKTKNDYPLEKDFLSNVSVDCIVFGYHDKELKVLCSKITGMETWSLPGGHVKMDEDINDAAYRILEQRTGVKGLFLKQFQAVGGKERSLKDTDFSAHTSTLNAIDVKKISWIIHNRFVSICYYALTEFSKVEPKPGYFDSACEWVDVHRLPKMLLDHDDFVKKALKTLRLQIHHEPVGLHLLPEKFTLPELQSLYETVLGKRLDQRNFTKKLVSLEILRKLNEKKNIGGHRSPSLYKFNKGAYNNALKKGIELAF